MKPGGVRFAGWIAFALAVALADQAAKWGIAALLRPGEAREIAPFFNLVLTFNRGAAFSFLADASGWQNALFIAVAIAASGAIVWLLWRDARETPLGAGLALILGGALGNLWDRVQLGHVVDFLDLHAFGWHWPAFNLADSAITIGAALVILDGLWPRAARDGG